MFWLQLEKKKNAGWSRRTWIEGPGLGQREPEGAFAAGRVESSTGLRQFGYFSWPIPF